MKAAAKRNKSVIKCGTPKKKLDPTRTVLIQLKSSDPKITRKKEN